MRRNNCLINMNYCSRRKLLLPQSLLAKFLIKFFHHGKNVVEVILRNALVDREIQSVVGCVVSVREVASYAIARNTVERIVTVGSVNTALTEKLGELVTLAVGNLYVIEVV